jgi:hypothetical protein
MIRLFAIFSLCSILLGCSSAFARSPAEPLDALPPDAVVLRVEVLENIYTGFSPPSDCPEGKQCVEFYWWSKYRARVIEVISGDWDQEVVTFARLEHASFIDKVTRDCYVILRTASPDFQSKLHVPFIAKKLLSNFVVSHRAEIQELRKGR